MPPKYKGAPRTLADPSPVRACPPPPKTDESASPPPPREPEGPPPGPDNRSMKMSVKDSAPVKLPDVDDGTYKLTGADVKGMTVGSAVKAKTFADAKPGSRQRPLVANVKFVVQVTPPVNVEAKFQTSEKLVALYEFLETHVFESVEKFEIKKAFPAVIIPRDEGRALAGLNIYGSVMLNVMVTGNAVIKKEEKSEGA